MKTLNKDFYRKVLSASLLLLIIFIYSGCKKEDNSYNSNSGGSGSSGTPPANEVWIQGMAFNPASISVAVNTTIKWTNKDGVAHTVTSNTAGTFDSGNLASGGTFSHQFTTAGSFPYHCTIHSGMTGTVTVH